MPVPESAPGILPFIQHVPAVKSSIRVRIPHHASGGGQPRIHQPEAVAAQDAAPAGIVFLPDSSGFPSSAMRPSAGISMPCSRSASAKASGDRVFMMDEHWFTIIPPRRNGRMTRLVWVYLKA